MQHESEALIKPGYDPQLTNSDLAPLKKQTWSSYNIFAFWMSDVHSVGGYVMAGSLFALGLNSWQVLVSLLIGIVIVQFFANLIAKPSQKTSTPFPVICRATFGVFGANIPAVIRGLIAVAWYGIQTYLASSAFILVILKFWPEMAAYADVKQYSFLGLSYLGWVGFMLLWVLQAVVFWSGMNSIRKFIDWAGPAVYVVMFAMAVWLVYEAGWNNINMNLGGVKYDGWQVVPVMIGAIALVVSYFSGPVLNFGDFSRYGKTFEAVKFGNFLGLPVNFLGFSILTVVCIAATLPIYGKLITDPVEMVGQLNNTFVVVLGCLTLMIATIGINIVANFVSPAFDFSNVSPNKISWRMGGMIAAVGSIFITPWNLFNNPQVIHCTIDVLGALIGPLFGILIADYYIVKKQRIVVDDLYSINPQGEYWYQNGYNPKAIAALIPAAIIPILCVLLPQLHALANFSWFIGMFAGLIIYSLISVKQSVKIRSLI
ncbi:NCS1 family nucleobase:cation symporter-1 [Acinetobacter ursingii]|uniref:NCS1 family nucleobase:cation symporter-1 n=1 Tax=Acinetobacter ursingii TaxID=108980 RepID=UPI00124FAECA|nr:NCS1 family nucleobase:cation symporter-1 [Acinetobacter ursingii]